MLRLDTRIPPDRSDVEADLAERFGNHASVRPRAWWRPRREQPGSTLLPAKVLERGRVRTVWLDVPLPRPRAPRDFRVVAVIAAHNEEDILGFTVRGLVRQGLEVIVLDHASDDGTATVLDRLEAEGLLVGREVIPEPSTWPAVLQYKAEVVAASGADWGIHSDADELRSGPWPGLSLRDAFWAAESFGADVVDFTVVNHLPVRGRPQGDPRLLTNVDLALKPGYFAQQKAWRATSTPDLGRSGGHRAEISQATTFPLNFRCDHYPVRSQEHGRRKVDERRERRARERIEHPNRHSQYDHVTDDHDFEVEPDVLPTASADWDDTNRARLLFRSGMEPDPDYRLV